MTNSSHEIPEPREISPKQIGLVESAHRLLQEKGVTEHPYFRYEPRTKSEKLGYLITKLAGKRQPSEAPLAGYFDKPVKRITVCHMNLKNVGGWGDMLKLKQTVVEDLTTGESDETLETFIEEVYTAPAATEMGAWRTRQVDRTDLLAPMADEQKINELQSFMDARQNDSR